MQTKIHRLFSNETFETKRLIDGRNGKKSRLQKQSVFLRIQVRASGQTKGLERG